jgi:hypothetical protein
MIGQKLNHHYTITARPDRFALMRGQRIAFNLLEK